MAGHDPGGLRGSGPPVADPADQAAVEGGNVIGEEKIAEEPGVGFLVADGNVRVGVRRRPGFEEERAVAEIEIEARADRSVGKTIRCPRRPAPTSARGGEILLRGRERLGEELVSDEDRAVSRKAALPRTWSGWKCVFTT